jgi:hypothetical protein
MQFLGRAQARQELDLVWATGRYLQQRALATGQEQKLIFAPDGSAYMFEGRRHRLGRALCCSKNTFARHEIIFYPTGIISAGAVTFAQGDQPACSLTSAVGTVSYLRRYYTPRA